MKNLREFNSKIDFVLTDIDDTLTDEGLLGADAYNAIWSLHQSGKKIIPVTGRPAGWCELIARQWPVAGVIGENGGFYFRYDQKQKKMKRFFVVDEKKQKENRSKLNQIQFEILKQIPNAAISSDQFTRLMDLAIDFCEDIPPLTESEVEQIVSIFKKYGAQAKISSIHVNGWFGDYDKVTTAKLFLKNEFNLTDEEINNKACFVGDSPNDEPLFAAFSNSIGVANIKNFAGKMKTLPQYVASNRGGKGFAEVAQKILNN